MHREDEVLRRKINNTSDVLKTLTSIPHSLVKTDFKDEKDLDMFLADYKQRDDRQKISVHARLRERAASSVEQARLILKPNSRSRALFLELVQQRVIDVCDMARLNYDVFRLVLSEKELRDNLLSDYKVPKTGMISPANWNIFEVATGNVDSAVCILGRPELSTRLTAFHLSVLAKSDEQLAYLILTNKTLRDKLTEDVVVGRSYLNELRNKYSNNQELMRLLNQNNHEEPSRETSFIRRSFG